MPRLQILELPEGVDDDRPPFVLVVDQWENPFHGLANQWAAKLGARAALVHEGTLELPANEVPVAPDGYPLKLRVEGDFEEFRAQVQDEIRKARAEMGDVNLRRTF